MSDVLATGWFAADAANVKPGGTAVVVGDGAVGLLAVLAGRSKANSPGVWAARIRVVSCARGTLRRVPVKQDST